MLSGLRVRRAAQPLTDAWRRVPVEPRGAALLGISFRPLQAEALGLEPRAALAAHVEADPVDSVLRRRPVPFDQMLYVDHGVHRPPLGCALLAC